MDFILLLISYGVFQRLFLMFMLIFLQKADKTSRQIMFALIAVLTLLSLDYVLSNYYLLYKASPFWGLGLSGAFWFAIAPLFYLLSLSLFQKESLNYQTIAIHLAPLLIVFLVHIPFYLLAPALRQEYFVTYSMGQKMTMQHLLTKMGYHIQLLLYPILIYRLMKSKKIAALSFLGSINSGLLLLGLLSFIHLVSFNIFQISLSWFTSQLVFLYLSFLIHATAIFFLIKPDWISQKLPTRISKYTNTNLAKLDLPQIAEQLSVLIHQQKIYKDPKLNLSKMAQLLALSPHQLSEYLNRENGASFHAFINAHRIREAQRLLSGSKRNLFTVESVAYEVGFNSTATFYRNFRKCVGASPGVWGRGGKYKHQK